VLIVTTVYEFFRTRRCRLLRSFPVQAWEADFTSLASHFAMLREAPASLWWIVVGDLSTNNHLEPRALLQSHSTHTLPAHCNRLDRPSHSAHFAIHCHLISQVLNVG
jgi:hypothetical protein